jgi:hypothetical protein
VPYRYYKQRVTLKASATLIEIYSSDRTRIAVHERRYTGKRYATIREHMPANHQAIFDRKGRDGNSYRAWAKTIGLNTFFVIDSLLSASEIEETAYRSCMGILQLGKKYGNFRLEEACGKARSLGSAVYTTIRNILKNGQEKTPDLSQAASAPIAVHANIRGASQFK